jgi:hypothetical protein
VLDGTIGGRVGDHEVVAGQGSCVVGLRRSEAKKGTGLRRYLARLPSVACLEAFSRRSDPGLLSGAPATPMQSAIRSARPSKRSWRFITFHMLYVRRVRSPAAVAVW